MPEPLSWPTPRDQRLQLMGLWAQFCWLLNGCLIGTRQAEQVGAVLDYVTAAYGGSSRGSAAALARACRAGKVIRTGHGRDLDAVHARMKALQAALLTGRFDDFIAEAGNALA